LFRAIPIMPQATQSSKCSLQLIQYNEGVALGWVNSCPFGAHVKSNPS
jgi:hypothetical protein